MCRTEQKPSIARVGSLIFQLFRDPGERHGLLWNFGVNGLAGSFLIPARIRSLLLRLFGIDVSPRALLRPRVIIRCSDLAVGAQTTINYGCVFDNRGGVKIGRRVGIGVGVKFLTTDHDSTDPGRRAGEGISKKIVIDDGVYIGSGVTVLSGVTISQGVVIAAGAVVTRDCKANGLYAGIPARRVKELVAGR